MVKMGNRRKVREFKSDCEETKAEEISFSEVKRVYET